MMSSTAQAMPESQVENLMQQVADEHGQHPQRRERRIYEEKGENIHSLSIDLLSLDYVFSLGLEFSSGLNALPNGINKLGQKVEEPQQANKSNVLLANGPQQPSAAASSSSNNNKKGGDNKPSGDSGGSGGGGAAVSSGNMGSSSGVSGGGGIGAVGDDDESSLEDRLRRLQQ